MLRFLSTDIICSEIRTVFPESSLRKTVSVVERIMFKLQIYKNLFAPNGGYCVYYPLNLFHDAHSFEN